MHIVVVTGSLAWLRALLPAWLQFLSQSSSSRQTLEINDKYMNISVYLIIM